MAKQVEHPMKVLGKIPKQETPEEQKIAAWGSVEDRAQSGTPEPKKGKVLGSQPRGAGG